MKKSNPYDLDYVMIRDACSYEQALTTIERLKEKNAWSKGKKLSNKSNPYNPNYVMIRDACSYEQALDTIDNFKKSKATSLINFINKYGETLGQQKYNEWKEKSLAKGHIIAKTNGKSQSKFSPAYYIRHGHNNDEAIKLAKDFQYQNSPLHIEYYIKRGSDLDYARKKIRSLHDKKIGRDCYKEHLIEFGYTHDEAKRKVKNSRGHCSKEKLGNEKFEERISKMRKTFEQKGIWIPLDDLSDYEIYRREVWKHTHSNDLTLIEGYEKRGRAETEGAFHLDHKFSISKGYIEGISPELIGSIKNLRFITWEENVKKQGKCSITQEELTNEN